MERSNWIYRVPSGVHLNECAAGGNGPLDCLEDVYDRGSLLSVAAHGFSLSDCLRESVERLPMRAKYTNVRAFSENEGSATGG